MLTEHSERFIRHVCTRREHVLAPGPVGSTMPHAADWAWCPSYEVTGHDWTPIKDMRSRTTDLADIVDALRVGTAAGS